MKAVKKGRIFIGFGLIGASLWLLVSWHTHGAFRPVLAVPEILRHFDDEHGAGRTYTIKDEKGRPLTMVSRRVRVGDEVITAEGKHYRVYRAGGNSATARFVGMDRDLLAYGDLFSKMALPAAKPGRNNRPVAIYHTHSDESYLPSDGTASIPFRGSIIQVGDTYKDTLSRDGAMVLHDKTPHDPHDDNAYYRSRRTAFQLLKKNPIAMFDVHRDGVDDPEFYRKFIANEEVAQVRIVLGRQNPHMTANLDFAKRLMAYANKMYWPIVKEIFIGEGNYNQDLISTAILLEAGTYTNRKEEAMGGIDRLADAVPIVLGITGPSSRPGAPEYGKPVTDPAARRSGVWSALWWLLIFTLLGGGAFLLISAGDFNTAKQRLYNFFRWEMPGLAGPLARKISFKNIKDIWEIAKSRNKKRV